MNYVRTLLIWMSLIISSQAIAEEKIYIREYTYQASDLDSKVSARNNTLKLIKASVLDEVISYVHNRQSIEQQQQGETFKSSFIQKTTSSSAGFVQARILEEHWNGFEMRIKAEVKADPELIRKELERSLAMQPGGQPQVDHQTKPVTKPVQKSTVSPQQQPQKVQVEVEVKIPDVVVQVEQQKLPASTTVEQPANQIPTASQQYVFIPQAMATNMAMPNYDGYQTAAKFTQAVMLLTPIKLRMDEYRMMNGNWPETLEDIRLKVEDTSDGLYINQIRLAKEGRIVAELSEQFGPNKKISLLPKDIMGGMQTRWLCETDIDMKNIPTMAVNCVTTDIP